jgi:hypothetical protein
MQSDYTYTDINPLSSIYMHVYILWDHIHYSYTHPDQTNGLADRNILIVQLRLIEYYNLY